MGGSSSKPSSDTATTTGNRPYDVYSREINPENQMPFNPNQVPLSDQQRPLSTFRVKSTIPKGNTDETWTYPSPQMFFNALKRKGKAEGVREEDMDVVIAIHNNMNERTWKLLQQWEQQRKSESDPKLLKFLGRPKELSPKAVFWSLLGFEKPFDRHDWTVERGGKYYRYIIDYYHVEEGATKDQVPGLHDHNSVRSIFIDVRPALDDLDSIRLRISNLFSRTGQELPSEADEGDLSRGKAIVEESIQVSPADLRQFLGSRCYKPIIEFIKCAETHSDMAGDGKCAKEFLGANFCLGSVICPDVSQKLLSTLQNDPDAAENVLMEMHGCIRQSKIAQDIFTDVVSQSQETK